MYEDKNVEAGTTFADIKRSSRMILKDIISFLEEMCPCALAQKWDNVGLLVGSPDMQVHTVGIALDATTDVIEEAVREDVDLLLTHHPMIFGGIRRVTDDDFVGRRVLSLVRNGVALYAMHTSFDVLGMADAAADLLKLTDREVLEVTYEDELSVEGLGRIGTLQEPLRLREYAQRVAEVFGIEGVRYYGDPEQMLVTCAVLPGAGKDEIDLALSGGADVMITGDITHHVGIDACEKGIAVIDAGHYGMEKIFIPYMQECLERDLKELRIISCDKGPPFCET